MEFHLFLQLFHTTCFLQQLQSYDDKITLGSWKQLYQQWCWATSNWGTKLVAKQFTKVMWLIQILNTSIWNKKIGHTGHSSEGTDFTFWQHDWKYSASVSSRTEVAVTSSFLFQEEKPSLNISEKLCKWSNVLTVSSKLRIWISQNKMFGHLMSLVLEITEGSKSTDRGLTDWLYGIETFLRS